MNFRDLITYIEPLKPEGVLFLGLGNEWRGDDGAGLYLFNRLKNHPQFRTMTFIEAGTNPENHLREILRSTAGHLLIIDAARSGKPPGTIHFLDQQYLSHNHISTHTYSIAILENYLNTFRPIRFHYLGIEPLSTVLHRPLSDKMIDSIGNFFKDHAVRRAL